MLLVDSQAGIGKSIVAFVPSFPRAIAHAHRAAANSTDAVQ
jgi:hypothetical protein